MGRIKNILEDYCKNIDKQRALNDSLLLDLDKKEWVEKMRSRSISLRKLTEDNAKITSELSAMLSGTLSEEEYEELCSMAIQMYQSDYVDFEVLSPILKKLLDKYDNTNKYNRRLFIYDATNYIYNEVYNRGSGEMHVYREMTPKIFALKEHYAEIEDQGRFALLVAHYNDILVETDDPDFDVNRSYEKLKETIAFWNSPLVQELDGKNEKILDIYSKLICNWTMVVKYVDDASDEVKAYLSKYAEEFHQKELDEKKELWEYDGYVYAAFLRMRAEAGLLTMDDAVDAYLEYYQAVLKNKEETGEIDSWMQQLLITMPEILTLWAKKLSDPERKRKVINVLMDGAKKTLFRDVKRLTSQFTNMTLANWCLSMLPFLSNAQEKEDWIFRLLVKNQLPTYLHSVMVSHFARAYAETVMERKPSLFDSLPDAVKKDAPSFFASCGLLHDIGKTLIADVINLQGRKLSDIEIGFIRRHPRYGYNFLIQDEDLACYADVAMGHHRFHDGSKGYPEDYDPSASPYRIAVDLIRICDTLDAATDHLGRSYQSTKNFQMVWEELKRDAGTSFNPELVALLDEAPELAEKLRFLCEEGREDLMYEAYKESLKIC